MDALLREQRKTAETVNLQKSLVDVDKIINLLEDAQNAVSQSPETAALTLAKLQAPMKSGIETVRQDLKEVDHGLRNHSKTVDKLLDSKELPSTKFPAFSEKPGLVNRAIGMHLMREGQFGVASTFIKESEEDKNTAMPDAEDNDNSEEQDFTDLKSETLRSQFKAMYDILEDMRVNRNLGPATAWARDHRPQLEARGSNLEFELARLKFLHLFTNGSTGQSLEAQRVAIQYAREAFGAFQERYLKQVQQLVGAMAFSANLEQSPYKDFLIGDSEWEKLAVSFTREFCSLLGLSADSPVYIASIAGAIALPRLQKMEKIMESHDHANWTTQSELPVEIPLPTQYRFHSIFVCPVSKEQTTDENPPIMMSCGHVIARDSLKRIHLIGSKLKCPYCPTEFRPDDGTRIYL